MPKKQFQLAPDFIPDGSPDFIPDSSAQEQSVLPPKLTVGAPSSLPMKTTLLDKASSLASDAGNGIAEGAANTTASLGKLGLAATTQFVPGSERFTLPAMENLEARRQNAARPENSTQNIFKALEQTGEFFLPDAALSDVAKGLEVAKDAPAAAKVFSLAKRGLLSGASTAGVSAAQGQSPKQVATSAGVGAVSPALSDMVASAGPKAAKNIYTRLVRPGAGEFTLDEAREAGTALANEAPVAATRRGLLQKTINAKQKVGQQIGDAISGATNSGKTVDISDALKPIEGAMDTADQAGNPQLYRQLQDLHDSISNVFEGGKKVEVSPILQRVFSLSHDGAEMPNRFALRDLSSMTPEDANLLKRNVQSDVDFSIPNSKVLNNTGKAVQGSIGDILRKEIPEVGPLNDQYSGLSNAISALSKSAPAEERALSFSVPDILTALSTGGAGALVHGPEGAALAGAVGLFGRKAAKSTLVNTVKAAALKNAAKAGPAVKAARNFALANQ